MISPDNHRCQIHREFVSFISGRVQYLYVRQVCSVLPESRSSSFTSVLWIIIKLLCLLDLSGLRDSLTNKEHVRSQECAPVLPLDLMVTGTYAECASVSATLHELPSVWCRIVTYYTSETLGLGRAEMWKKQGFGSHVFT